MIWLRMITAAFRLAGPYGLMPWRSPLLRWRMETYGFLTPEGRLGHAGDVTPQLFIRFLRERAGALWSFLRWAAELKSV